MRLQPALRLGLCLVNGLAQAAANRLVAARRTRPFADIRDLARRAELGVKDLRALAAAGAFASVAGHRRNALWQASGMEAMPEMLRDAAAADTAVDLAPPGEGEDLIADYETLGLTLGRHPLALLRSELDAQRMVPAERLRTLPHGRNTRVTGLVTGRQRPGSAQGVVFVTLEDETGNINVIVWPNLVEKQRRELLGASLLTVYGRLERQGEVIHVIADRLRDQTGLLGGLVSRSRDFH